MWVYFDSKNLLYHGFVEIKSGIEFLNKVAATKRKRQYLRFVNKKFALKNIENTRGILHANFST